MKKHIKRNLIFLLSLLIVSITSCGDNIKRKLADEEQAKIADYLATNPTLAFQHKQSGLYYLDVVVGPGAQVQTGDSAYVFYNMKLLDGRIFETNVGSTDTLRVLVGANKLAVKGVDEALTYMKEGGQAFLLVPSSLAFGEVGISTIGGYTPLLFDLYLVRLRTNHTK